MVDGDVLGPPYAYACSLAEWADANWGYLDGRLALAGSSVDAQSFSKVLNVAYAVLVEEAATLGITREGLNARLLVGWEAELSDGPPSPQAEAAAEASLLGGITMDDLLAEAGE